MTCSADLTDAPSRRQRCPECARDRQRRLSRERQARRLAERIAGGLDAQAAEAKRRTSAYLRSSYGITLAEYEAMVESQRGLCAICGNAPIGRGRTNSLVVDHCHKGGHVRELLCGKCNSAIGLLDDDPRIVVKAAAYLRKHRVLTL